MESFATTRWRKKANPVSAQPQLPPSYWLVNWVRQCFRMCPRLALNSVPKIHTGLKLTILLLLLLLFLVCWNYKHEPGISNIFSKNLLQFIYEMLLQALVLEHLFPSWWHCLRKLWNLWNVGFADRHRPLGLVLRVTAWPCFWSPSYWLAKTCGASATRFCCHKL